MWEEDFQSSNCWLAGDILKWTVTGEIMVLFGGGVLRSRTRYKWCTGVLACNEGRQKRCRSQIKVRLEASQQKVEIIRREAVAVVPKQTHSLTIHFGPCSLNLNLGFTKNQTKWVMMVGGSVGVLGKTGVFGGACAGGEWR